MIGKYKVITLCGSTRFKDGKLKTLPREDVLFIIEWLIEKHYILKTKGLYPVLHPTYEGNHFSETMTHGQLLALKRKLEATESEV